MPYLDSWRRQPQCLTNLLAAFDSESLLVSPGPESMAVHEHFAHIHQTSLCWLGQASGGDDLGVHTLLRKESEGWHASVDPGEIAEALEESAAAVETFVVARLRDGAPIKQYDHPVLLMQHLMWHDGWHVGLLWLARRIAGREPAEDWEESNLWTLWRGEAEWSQ